MTEYLLEQVPTYGLWLWGVVTFLACLALPVPCSILMLTAGGFVATGDLVLWQVMAAALKGAVLGDQFGYRIGLIGGHGLLTRLAASPKRAALMGKAVSLMDRRGAVGIFFTRWLFAPVGPWANFAAGATAFNYARFTLWAVAGSALGIFAGIAAMLGFGYWLMTATRHENAQKSRTRFQTYNQ